VTPADKITEQIVKTVFGPQAAASADWLRLAARHLASPANNEAGRSLAAFCQRFLNVYKNWNYNLEVNGELWLLRRLAAFEPSVVFDVGANVGDWLLAAAQELPSASFHAFEIMEETYATLATRAGDQPRVRLNAFGLSDMSGTLTMRAFESSSTLATHTAYPHGPCREFERPVQRGDKYLREHQLSRIDFLKLDVEGAEHLVLRGFSEALDAGSMDIIQFEYGRVAILTHFLLKDFHDLLESKGFSVGKLFPDHVDFRPYKLEDEDFLGPNYVAVRCERADIIEALRKKS
jgi:FkbM family methyltransferase